MTTLTPFNQRYRLAWACALSLGVASASALVATPVALASSRPALSAAAICGKVSASSVSTVMGYTVPAPTPDTLNLKATRKNDHIASEETSCTYGADTLAALPKDVILAFDVTSKPLTSAELKQDLTQVQKLNITFVPYHGLGAPAYYYTFSVGGTIVRGISVLKGVDEYGAFVYTNAAPKSKLAALARLAEKL